MWTHQFAYFQRGKEPQAESVKAMLEGIVDEHAKAKIDRLVHCVFALSHGTVPPGFKRFSRHYIHLKYRDNILGKTGIPHLEEAGYDVIELLLDRAHEHGMEFVAGMRKVVDDAAQKRGRTHLLLGTRVPQTMEEC